MSAAYYYFAAMAALAVPIAILHIMCRAVMRDHPQIMPDREARYNFNAGQVFMASMCLSGLWHMWGSIPGMIFLCASEPIKAAFYHLPWLISMTGGLYYQTQLWRRMINQVATL